jgi:hypothetical protein
VPWWHAVTGRKQTAWKCWRWGARSSNILNAPLLAWCQRAGTHATIRRTP